MEVKYVAISPDNEIIKINSLNKFSAEHNLTRTKVTDVVQKRSKRHKGFSVFNVNEENLEQKIADIINIKMIVAFTTGDKIELVDKIGKYCLENELQIGSVLLAIKEEQYYYSRRYFFKENTTKKFIKKFISEHKVKLVDRYDEHYDYQRDNNLGKNTVYSSKMTPKKLMKFLKDFDDADIPY